VSCILPSADAPNCPSRHRERLACRDSTCRARRTELEVRSNPRPSRHRERLAYCASNRQAGPNWKHNPTASNYCKHAAPPLQEGWIIQGGVVPIERDLVVQPGLPAAATGPASHAHRACCGWLLREPPATRSAEARPCAQQEPSFQKCHRREHSATRNTRLQTGSRSAPRAIARSPHASWISATCASRHAQAPSHHPKQRASLRSSHAHERTASREAQRAIAAGTRQAGAQHTGKRTAHAPT